MNLYTVANKLAHAMGRLDAIAISQQRAYKTGITGRTSSTRSNDPDLAGIPLLGNRTYFMECFFSYWSATAGAGFAVGFGVPSGATGRWGGTFNKAGATVDNWDFDFTQVATLGTPAGQNNGVVIRGTLFTTNAGSLNVSWGNSDNVHTVNLNNGSHILLVDRT